MIDLMPGLTFSDAEKQAYGSIIGSLLGAAVGALLGALAAFAIGVYARNKEIEKQKLFENRKIMNNSRLACAQAGAFIMSTLVQNEFNRGTGFDIAKGIQDESNNLTFQINTPEPYSVPPDKILDNLCNDDIVVEWLSLRQEIKLQNSNIINFRDYYTFLRTTVLAEMHTGHGESLEMEIIESDKRTIAKVTHDQQAMHDDFKERCMKIQAKLLCYNEYHNSFDLKDSISLSEHREMVTRLYAYKPTKKTLATRLAMVREVNENLILNKPDQ